ncbi:hypothetical protein, conserved [Babesia ovata]|uniref:6-Cys domain-containing protein n=1 Tax=Babesia ovata TaxID=189622 RepID=A0A2H6KEK6_9APIC|nr:uncharacterized protein BOVATA_028820 [Babesia ovata]GBE61389.1 hypothetical protein, conserved [Babesia ovata]
MVICPRRVNGTEYVWHPRPTPDGSGQVNTYVGENGNLRSAAISEIVVSEATRSFFWAESDGLQTNIHIDLRDDDIYAITENRLIFICGPRGLILSDALQHEIHHFGVTQPYKLPWSPATALTQVISKVGNGLGVFIINRGFDHLPLQGCGSRPSPLFAVDNEVLVDPVTGIRSCVADSMSQSRIGFVCEGKVEPEYCMRSLLYNDDVVTAPGPFSYWSFYNNEPWVVARYFNDLAVRPFNGECRCVNSETGQMKARIEIRTKTDYVCDISRTINRNHLNNIRGPWCSYVLHPGSTLTIRFPTQDMNENSDGHLSQLLPIDQFETEFLPNDLKTLRQLANVYSFDVYDEILYHEALAGDALEIDVSQMSRGVVKLKYHLDKPLTSIGGHNSFLYHWTLKSKNAHVPHMIRAIVNVSFAFTHHYHIVGCDRETPALFDRYVSRNYCSTKLMGNGIGDIYECTYNKTSNILRAGIYCRREEELLPNNCESTGYDLYANQTLPFTKPIRRVTPYPILSFQVFTIDFRETSTVSYACICVNQRGYETSRLILESNQEVNYTYKVRRGHESHALLPDMTMPWTEVGLSSEGLTSPRSVILYNVSLKSIVLGVGTTLFMVCDPYQHNVAHNERIATTWLPKRPEEYYYTVNHTPNGSELVRLTYKESFAITPGGLKVRYQDIYRRHGCAKLTIELRRSAILVSKDPLHKKYVPMTFVCGKVTEPSDLSFVTDGVSTSAASPPPKVQGVKSSARYTWHMVQVNVETTDPYMPGCGVTYASDELFKPETPQLYDADGQPQFGCRIDLQDAKEAAFYCPAPYVLDPPNCFSQVLVDGSITNLVDVSKSLRASRSNHFVILRFESSKLKLAETLRQTPPLECRCVTVKGIILSTIQIENYYAK